MSIRRGNIQKDEQNTKEMRKNDPALPLGGAGFFVLSAKFRKELVKISQDFADTGNVRFKCIRQKHAVSDEIRQVSA